MVSCGTPNGIQSNFETEDDVLKSVETLSQIGK